MSTGLDEVARPKESIDELMEKLHLQMRKFELLKKVTDLGVIDGLGVVPLEKVLPTRIEIGKTLGEGSQEEEEQRETNEDAPTQPPSTVVTQVSVTTPPMPPPVDTTIVPPRTQAFRTTTKTVIVQNIKSL